MGPRRRKLNTQSTVSSPALANFTVRCETGSRGKCSGLLGGAASRTATRLGPGWSEIQFYPNADLRPDTSAELALICPEYASVRRQIECNAGTGGNHRVLARSAREYEAGGSSHEARACPG